MKIPNIASTTIIITVLIGALNAFSTELLAQPQTIYAALGLILIDAVLKALQLLRAQIDQPHINSMPPRPLWLRVLFD